jgi:hypothetical protein
MIVCFKMSSTLAMSCSFYERDCSQAACQRSPRKNNEQRATRNATNIGPGLG